MYGMVGSRLLMCFCCPLEYNMVSFIIFLSHHTCPSLLLLGLDRHRESVLKFIAMRSA